MTLQDSVSHEELPKVQPLEWCRHGFDHHSRALAQNLHETMAQMREQCPVAAAGRLTLRTRPARDRGVPATG